MTLQRSALHSIAAAAGGGLQERFGWELPQVYTDTSSEYRAATEAAAVHDASYLGRLKAVGADALDLLNRMSTNLVLGLEPGQGAPTILTTDRGRILDLVGVVNTADYVLLLTSPGQQQNVIEWLDKYTIMEDLTVTDLTAETTMLAVFGPHSQARLEELLDIGLGQLPSYHSLLGSIAGGEVRIIRRPLGELPSFDLILSPEAAPPVWQQLTGAGITPVGLEAYQAVRVRYAVPLYGHEMGDAYNPLEAGLIGSVDFHKGCYIGQEVIARLDTYQKVQKHLVMLRFSSDATASPGASLERNSQAVGAVTSVSRIPTTGELIGLGYVRTASAAVGTRLELAAPSSGWAEIEALPQLFGPGQG
jgi:folate-binding protein YgfZ